MAKSRKAKPDPEGRLPQEKLFAGLREFGRMIQQKFAAHGPGEPEDHLRNPFEQLFHVFAENVGRRFVLKGEAKQKDRIGRPDFAVHEERLLLGHIELKAPGKGVDPAHFKGHDRDQWERFRALPNVLYSDGGEWTIYRSGERLGKTVRLEGDLPVDGGSKITDENAAELFQLLADFIAWKPIVPQEPKDLAAYIAPYCRFVRQQVLDALEDPASPLVNLREEIKKLLFPDASDDQFADAYAQTVTFALLLAHLEGADVLDLAAAYARLSSHHLLLSRSLQFLTDPEALKEISSSVSLVQRVIHEIDPDALAANSLKEDPWLFFYEHFLATYDPKLRKSWGVYYTPVEIVRCQVRLIDEILKEHLNKPMGFIEPGVITLDPALGTGTYLLGIVDHALRRVAEEEGPGAVKSGARLLITQLHGFEWMVGPYAVAQLRFSRALTARGTTIPDTGIGIYLTNSLESPHEKPPTPVLFHRPMADEHEKALRVKDSKTVLVCLGNPPYGRHSAATQANRAATGGWVRHGGANERPIMDDFTEPARAAGHGGDLKNLYNLYVYFIRWSLWKVFEHKSAVGPGIVSFITASSYLDGDAFAGLREHMRRHCDHVDIIDLGGEGRGTHKDENVFAIQTPVCIFVAWRNAKRDKSKPGIVRYARVEGSRVQKLDRLEKISSRNSLEWQEISSEWQAPFRPVQRGAFSKWPNLTDLLPWQISGVQIKRTWPISPDSETLIRRWELLVKSSDKAKMFRETRDRRISRGYPDLRTGAATAPIQQCGISDAIQPVRYGHRSFDRKFVFPDNRLGDFMRPVLWRTYSDSQIFLSTLLTQPLGTGPALTVTAHVPDLDYFRGSFGAKNVLPLYRDSAGRTPNVMPQLLALLSGVYGAKTTAEDLIGYVYAILAQPAFAARFERDLAERVIRVPLTKDGQLFLQVCKFGRHLIWLHTYGERMFSSDLPKGSIPKGKAKCLVAVSEDEDSYPSEFEYDGAALELRVGNGRFGPVTKEAFAFEVSGLKVVPNWLSYRMKERSGKKSSPLDEIGPRTWSHQFTKELLELLWVVENTLAGYSAQEQLLDNVLAGKLFMAKELPAVPPAVRKSPTEGESSGSAGGWVGKPNLDLFV